MRRPLGHAAILATLVVLSGCSRPRGLFVEENARAHVEMLAGTIGSRPTGTAANAQARSYIIDQLKLYGFDVRVQETDARRADLGRTARVANIIATLPGQRSEAIGLLSHYDARADTPGRQTTRSEWRSRWRRHAAWRRARRGGGRCSF